MQELKKVFDKKKFNTFIVKDVTEIIDIINNELPQNSTIGFGGSMTVRELEIPKKLESFGHTCNDATTSKTPWHELGVINKTVKFNITGCNAITKDGYLVNLDGRGNRVANQCYGPEKTFYVLSKNKIVDNIDGAINRIKTIAAPKNCKRLNLKTPCTITGKCENCESPESICRAWSIIQKPPIGMQVYIIILDTEKEIGF